MKYLVLIFISLVFFKESTGILYYDQYSRSFQYSVECENDEDCQTLIENSICKSYTCQCSENTLLSSDGSKCLNKVNGFGDECEDNAQCSKFLSGGGVCVNNKCRCKEGFHYKDKKCWKNVDLNEECKSREQCFSAYEYVGLDCISRKCKCRSQYYQRLDSGCRRRRNINETCNLDTDCPEGSICNRQLICSYEEVASIFLQSYQTFEEKLSDDDFELGRSCDNDLDCKDIENSVCLESKVCACTPAKYVASENNKRCLPMTRGKVEDIRRSTCQENAQCAVFGGNSICKNRKCECKDGTYWEATEKFCWRIKFIGDKCKFTQDCHPSQTNAECKNEICTCKKDYHQKGDICVRDALKVGDYCEEDTDCNLIWHSFCNESNACTCKENYYVQNGKCVGGVKSICETDADCCHLKNTKCRSTNSSSWQCLCLDNYVSSDKGDYCLPDVKYQSQCEESFQCKTNLGQDGECREGVCQCKSKTHYTDGKCYRSKFAKESCSRLQECHPGNDTSSVICLKGFCSCNYGYELDRLGFCVKTNSAAQMKPYFYVMFAALLLLHKRS